MLEPHQASGFDAITAPAPSKLRSFVPAHAKAPAAVTEGIQEGSGAHGHEGGEVVPPTVADDPHAPSSQRGRAGSAAVSPEAAAQAQQLLASLPPPLPVCCCMALRARKQGV